MGKGNVFGDLEVRKNDGGGGVKIQLLTGYRRSFLVQIIEMCEKPKIQ